MAEGGGDPPHRGRRDQEAYLQFHSVDGGSDRCCCRPLELAVSPSSRLHSSDHQLAIVP